jgi:hypothetical protein
MTRKDGVMRTSLRRLLPVLLCDSGPHDIEGLKALAALIARETRT